MAGRTIRICPPRDFDYTGLQTATDMIVTLAERVDASQFEQVDLIIRLHAEDLGAGSTIAVGVFADGFTPDEPNVDFFSTAALGTATFTENTAVGAVSVIEITQYLGNYLAVLATCHRGTGNATARISCDLVLKTN